MAQDGPPGPLVPFDGEYPHTPMDLRGLIHFCSLVNAGYVYWSKAKPMPKPIKYVEKAVTLAAGAAWTLFERFNRIKPNAAFTPKWSDKPLLKSYEKMKPKLGWPRQTDSLCPKLIPAIRHRLTAAALPLATL